MCVFLCLIWAWVCVWRGERSCVHVFVWLMVIWKLLRRHMAWELGYGATGNDQGCSIVSFPCWSPLWSTLHTNYMCPCSISCFHFFFFFFSAVGEEFDQFSSLCILILKISLNCNDACKDKGLSVCQIHYWELKVWLFNRQVVSLACFLVCSPHPCVAVMYSVLNYVALHTNLLLKFRK